MENLTVTGIVLAGGKSSRMGTDKSMMKWHEKTLVEHALETLKPICNKSVISSNQSIYDFTGCETWPDEIPKQAPIIGIYSCLKRSETEINIFLSCDMPLIGTELFRYLLSYQEKYKIIIPTHNEMFIEPLCGVYKKSALPDLEKFILNQNFTLHKFINTSSSFLVPVNSSLPFYRSNMFSNINTLEDYNKLNGFNN